MVCRLASQAIIGTNAGVLSIDSLWTNFSEILIKIYNFLFKKMHLKMPFGKWRSFCVGLNLRTMAPQYFWKWEISQTGNDEFSHSYYVLICYWRNIDSRILSMLSLFLSIALITKLCHTRNVSVYFVWNKYSISLDGPFKKRLMNAFLEKLFQHFTVLLTHVVLTGMLIIDTLLPKKLR